MNDKKAIFQKDKEKTNVLRVVEGTFYFKSRNVFENFRDGFNILMGESGQAGNLGSTVHYKKVFDLYKGALEELTEYYLQSIREAFPLKPEMLIDKTDDFFAEFPEVFIKDFHKKALDVLKKESNIQVSTKIEYLNRRNIEFCQEFYKQEVIKYEVRPSRTRVVPDEIVSSLEKFKNDHEGETCVFIMMQFNDTRLHNEIEREIKYILDTQGFIGLRADDKQYADDLFANVLTYVFGCDFGVAIFDRLLKNDFNPNVTLEVGYMMGLEKSVCYMKDATMEHLPTDLCGKLYKSFDTHDPKSTIPDVLIKWLQDKGMITESKKSK